MRRTILLTAVSSVVLWTASPATRYVSKDGSAQFPYLLPSTAANSIRDAVDAAEEGDTVLVTAGEYTERVTLREGISLRGEGPDRTVVTWGAESPDRVLTLADRTSVSSLAVRGGEDGIYGRDCAVELSDCWIYDASWRGVALLSCSVSVRGCRFWDCGTYLMHLIACRAEIVDSAFRGPGYSECVLLSRAWVARCDFSGTSIAASEFAKLRAEDCTFSDGGGVEATVSSVALLTRCELTNNAWGVYLFDGGYATLQSCVISGTRRENPSDSWFQGSAVYCDHENGGVEIIGCTITDNDFGLRTPVSGSFPHPFPVEIVGSIIWGNHEADMYIPDRAEVRLSVSHSDIGGFDGGYRCIDADPMFWNPAEADFRLGPGSPCIDAGTGHDLLGATDLRGRRRTQFGGTALLPDIGAHEFSIIMLQPCDAPSETKLTWSSVAQATYHVYWSYDLDSWYPAALGVPSAGNTTTSWVDDGTGGTLFPPWLVRQRFYRVVELR